MVLSADEIGFVSLQPQGEKGWLPKGKAGTIPATYTKNEGVRYEYSCLNVFHQQLSVRQEQHKGWRIWLRFLKYQRAKYPEGQRIYIIQDGLSAHWTPEVLRWAKENRVTQVPTATNASWINPVECQALPLQEAAMAGSDYRSWEEVNEAFQRGAALINRENQREGKHYRDSYDGRRKRRRPLWSRH